MKLHSQTARLSQVPPFPKEENMQSCLSLKLGLLPSDCSFFYQPIIRHET